MRGPGLMALLFMALVVSACGDPAETTASAAAPEATPTTVPPTTTATSSTPTTTAPPTTTTAAAPLTTLTFTGADCIQSGPDTVPVGILKFTLENESSVDMAVVVLELVDVTFEELVADDVRLFPPTTSWPPQGASPEESHSTRKVEAYTEVKHSVAFHNAGNYGTVCWPLDGGPAVQGALLTVEE